MQIETMHLSNLKLLYYVIVQPFLLFFLHKLFKNVNSIYSYILQKIFCNRHVACFSNFVPNV